MIKILINGSTSGLGRALTKEFHKKNYSLICTGNKKKKMKELQKITNNKYKYFAGDITKDKELKSLKLNLQKINNIDVIIHCMGGGLGIKDDLISKKQFLKLFDTNLFSQSEINNLLIKKAIKKKKPLKIIHISSIASVESVASVGYSTTKAALNVYSNILSKRLISKNIDIKNIILGAFETKDNSFARLKIKNFKAYKKFKNTRMPLKKFNTINEIFPLIEFILNKNSKAISGDIILDSREINSFRN